MEKKKKGMIWVQWTKMSVPYKVFDVFGRELNQNTPS